LNGTQNGRHIPKLAAKMPVENEQNVHRNVEMNGEEHLGNMGIGEEI
jgi:hypothetical protein